MSGQLPTTLNVNQLQSGIVFLGTPQNLYGFVAMVNLSIPRDAAGPFSLHFDIIDIFHNFLLGFLNPHPCVATIHSFVLVTSCD